MSGVAGHTVGPLRIGASAVRIRTASAAFAAAAEQVFCDLLDATATSAPTADVEFEVARHEQPSLHWSITRNGEPCEMELRDDAVLPHLQWELNRLVIDAASTAIHAASVVTGGAAVLLAGRSHSGKTTLAGWLAARNGFAFLADEVAAIDDVLQVAPFARPLGVRDDSPLAALAPGGAPPTSSDGSSGERLLAASRLGAVVHRRAAPVALLVFPRFLAGATPMSHPLDHATALERLAALTPGLVRHGGPVFERLAQLVTAAPAIEIVHGNVIEGAALVVAAVAPDSVRA